MADTAQFFDEFLKGKMADNKSIGKVFKFDITGAGTWLVDFGAEEITKLDDGAEAKADCTITCAQSDWEALLDNPSNAMSLFMMGKLKADNLGLATQLQKILG